MMDYDLERKYSLFLLKQERESKTLILELEYLIAVLFITEMSFIKGKTEQKW